ncbi:hypothetical protein NQ318_004850 [Aromia moschata]|uniref:Protein quiver n=1 Tax=Aromia moschata TaxID=1265417 RepID=A0AAV8Z2B1_9CUCU|nr:hypothetical protein NQ318_004850 [Aromia moschata]
MFLKVFYAAFIIVNSHRKGLATNCYSCDALDKHLPMSSCYFINNTTNTATCPSQCLFFQYIVPAEEYTYYDTDLKENTTVRGNVAHTVRSCAPTNINDTCVVNSTAAVVRQCVVCDTDLCNGSSKEVPAISALLIIAIIQIIALLS